MIRIMCLSLSILFGANVAIASSLASSNATKEVYSKTTSSFETTHLKKKKKTHRHCHTGIRNHKFIKSCHKHRHWPFHHVRKG